MSRENQGKDDPLISISLVPLRWSGSSGPLAIVKQSQSGSEKHAFGLVGPADSQDLHVKQVFAYVSFKYP